MARVFVSTLQPCVKCGAKTGMLQRRAKGFAVKCGCGLSRNVPYLLAPKSPASKNSNEKNSRADSLKAGEEKTPMQPVQLRFNFPEVSNAD
jgi:hypothetical protein